MIGLDGVNGRVTNSSLTWQPTAFTVAFWLYPLTRTDYNQNILATNGWGAFNFHTAAPGGIYVGTTVGTRFTPSQIPADTLVVNQWQHFVFTFDNGNAVFYKNGIFLASKTGMTNPIAWTGFQIGLTNIHTVNGTINELACWDVALSLPEISLLVNSKVKRLPLQIRPSNLKLYLPLDEVADGVSINGQTFKDLSGNGHDGTGADAGGESRGEAEEVLSYP